MARLSSPVPLAPAGLAGHLQQAALLYPAYLLQSTAGWLLLLAAAPHLGRLQAVAMLLNICHLAACTVSRSDDTWILKKIFPAKSVELALAFEDEEQLQAADAAARKAADQLGLWLAALVLYCQRAAAAGKQPGVMATLHVLWPLVSGLLIPRVLTQLLGMLVRWKFYAVAYDMHWCGWGSAARCAAMLVPATLMAVVALAAVL
jgi:hypothetical protein